MSDIIPDLTTVEGIEKLMASSNSHEAWLSNCERVKAANNWSLQGGPDWIIKPMLDTRAAYVTRYIKRFGR